MSKDVFFPTYENKYTRTPNVFFDEILCNPKANLNQVRLVGYLIRETLGYNRHAKWCGVSRKDLIDEAGIPNGRIKDAIEGCIKNNWILVHEEGRGARKKRYIFLNDERNQRILTGLKRGFFKFGDLEYLNLAGVDNLLETHGLDNTTTETVEEQTFSTETVEPTLPKRYSLPYRNGIAYSTETVETNTTQSQEAQEFTESLNTSFKDNNTNTSFKDNNIRNLAQNEPPTETLDEDKNVVVVSAENRLLIAEKWEELFEESLPIKKIEKIVDQAVVGMALKQIDIPNPTEKQIVERIVHVMEKLKKHSYPFKTNALSSISNALEHGYTWINTPVEQQKKKEVGQGKANAHKENIPTSLRQAAQQATATEEPEEDWDVMELEKMWNEMKAEGTGVK